MDIKCITIAYYKKTLFLKPFSQVYFLDFSHVECSIIEHKIIINLLGAHNIKSKRWPLLCETNVFHFVETKHGLNGLDWQDFCMLEIW